MTRTFTVQRGHDVTGISGTGPVANGAVSPPDGTTVVRWRELPDTHGTIVEHTDTEPDHRAELDQRVRPEAFGFRQQR